jgi:hypothetical protein
VYGYGSLDSQERNATIDLRSEPMSMMQPLVFSFLLSFSSAFGAGPQKANSLPPRNEVDVMQERLAASAGKISQLTVQSSPQDFSDALSSIEEISFGNARKIIPERSTDQVDQLWITFIGSLEAATRTARQSTQLPVTRVSPGRDSDGKVYMPGVSADVIKDPNIKTKYLADQTENESRRKRVYVIHDFSVLNLRVWSEFQTWLLGDHEVDHQRATKLRQIAAKQKLSDDSVQKIQALIK